MSSPATLAEAFESDAVSFDVLDQRYRPMLKLVRELIGVVPNCDPTLEIWPIGFRTYNLIVPNLLNLPKSLFGKTASKSLTGLAMYRSSRAAECAYCSAHTCSFALRRGNTETTIRGRYDSVQAATVRVAEGLSTIPVSVTAADVENFVALVPQRDRQWVVMGIAMMGFLNKFMDAMGIELEADAINDVSELISPDGWNAGKHNWYELPQPTINTTPPEVDGAGTYLRVVSQAPSAIRLERSWTKGVPDTALDARLFLERHVGMNFPMIEHLPNRACTRAVTTLLRDNLDPRHSAIGIGNKGLVGLIFASIADNQTLVSISKQIAADADDGHSSEFIHYVASAADADAAVDLAHYAGDHADAEFTEKLSTILSLAIAMSSSPAAVTASVVSDARAVLSGAEVVEIAVWISVLQMLHRIDTFYQLA